MLTLTTASEGCRRRVAYAVVGICAVVAVLAPDPDRFQRSLLSLHDFVHVPAFAVVTAALLFGFSGGSNTSSRYRVLRLFVTFAAAVMIGGAVELVQQAAWGSGADPWDVARDAGGAVIVVLFAASLWRDLRPSARWALRGVALAVAVASFVPTAAALRDEARARRQFPVLADFGAPSELTRFAWSDLSTHTLEPGDGGRGVLHLTLLPGEYPGLSFEFFPRDWRGWREFVLRCTNRGGAPLPVTIRIDDITHNGDYTDRYNRTFVLAPGRTEIQVPLADVESAPHGRTLDLAHVASVIVFSKDLQEPRELLFHELRLAR